MSSGTKIIGRVQMKIPDLRSNTDITLEHCFVLVELFGKTMDTIEGTLNVFQGMAEGLDPHLMKDYYETQFEPEAFNRLFQTELGKGVLVGAFAQSLLEQMAQDLENLDMEE
jgi:hypothetical protein